MTPRFVTLGLIVCLAAVSRTAAGEPDTSVVVLKRAEVKFESGAQPEDLFFRVRAAEAARFKGRVDGAEQSVAAADTVPLEKAEEDFSEVIKKNPADADALVRRGAGRASKGRPAAALKDL